MYNEKTRVHLDTDLITTNKLFFTHHICQNNVTIFFWQFLFILPQWRGTFMMFQVGTSSSLFETHVPTGRPRKLSQKQRCLPFTQESRILFFYLLTIAMEMRRL